MDFLFFETISYHIVLLKCKFSIISQDDYYTKCVFNCKYI